MDKKLFDHILRESLAGAAAGPFKDPKLLEGKIVRAQYIGPKEELKGKRALVRRQGGTTLAQFDDTNTGLGFSWHSFPVEEFNYMVDVDA